MNTITRALTALRTDDLPAPIKTAATLLEAESKGFTGVIRVARGPFASELHLAAGRVVFVHGGCPTLALGQLLITEGLIAPADYSAAVRLMTERLVDHEELRLGEALVHIGAITADGVHTALQLQLRRKLMDCVAGEVEWIEPGELEQPNVLAPLSPAMLRELILVVLRDNLDADVRADLVGRVGDLLPSLDLAALSNQRGISLRERRVLNAFDGRLSLRMVCADLRVNPAQLVPLLVVLVLADKLELRAASNTVRVKLARSQPQAEGTSPDFARRVPVRQPSIRSAALNSPHDSARHKAIGTGPIHRAPASRRQQLSSPAASSDSAEIDFKWGCRLLQQGRSSSAATKFAAAVKREPTRLSYRLYSAWTEYLCAASDGALEHKATVRALALEVLRTGTHPERAKAHVIVGHMLRLEDEHGAAVRHIKAALAANAADREAQREMRLLSRRQQPVHATAC